MQDGTKSPSKHLSSAESTIFENFLEQYENSPDVNMLLRHKNSQATEFTPNMFRKDLEVINRRMLKEKLLS